MNAIVINHEFPVRYTKYENVEFITFDVPNGWDDVKKVCKKVLSYDGKKFTFSCWNSDDLYCSFRRDWGVDAPTAKILRK